MDPNANLREQRRIAAKILADELVSESEVFRLAELIEALDQWLRRRGALPADWQR